MSAKFKEQEKLNSLLLQTDEYVRHEYLSVLDQASPIRLDKGYDFKTGSNLRLMHLKSMTYDSEDNIAQKIRSIYGSIERSGNKAALILDGREDCAHLYAGVFTDDQEKASDNYKAFISSFNGMFPGCVFRNLKIKACEDLMDELLKPPVKTAIAAVSAFPFKDGTNTDSIFSGLEILVDGMRGRPFTMMLLAEAVDRAELVQMRQGYESLYTNICPLQKQDISLSNSQTETIGTNFSRTIAESLSVSSGISKGYTDTTGTSRGTQTAPDSEKLRQRQAFNQIAGATVSVGVTALAAAVPQTAALGAISSGLLGSGGGGVLQGLFYGSGIANLLGTIENAIDPLSEEDRQSVSEGSHEDHSESVTNTQTTQKGTTRSEATGRSKSKGVTEGQTLQISYTNKSVIDLLERIDEQIQELRRLENEGAYRFAAYFIAGDEAAAVAAASLYRSIVTSGKKAEASSPVYHWTDEESCAMILQSLRLGFHPTFAFEDFPDFPFISAAQPIGMSDMPHYLCFPRKSVYGIEVTEHAAFARDILRREGYEKKTVQTLPIGSIYHMGKEVSTPVEIDTDTLTAHLFVSGATGVGKSNFCYQLLDSLLEKDVKVLVIEPAKGEYAKVFGGRDNFKVYGTSLRQAPPLRINPFAFPEGVEAAEHIERLLAIFNAAWPMYSAMPAIMKDALEEIYRRHGFDDIWGELPEGGSFPTFSDLLEVLPEIIQSSKYSAEVQGNYIGALVTRVKSLTNGIYNIIFSEDEIGDAQLFDENVIIDISRIGSEETKAFVMGVLITRLSEYRSCSGLMNSPLRHITLLEEAHHLLGKQSGGYSQDTGNMKSASVEMLTNAIREMRTYGEGFIIADQSPSVMDPSVIANTQTKVFFMMPRREDRMIAADALSLGDKQSSEIARLPKGVCAVFQNEWSAAVLCKIRYFSPDKHRAFVYKAQTREETYALLGDAVRILLRNQIFMKEEGNVPVAFEQEALGDRGFGLGRNRKVVLDILTNPEKYTGLSVVETARHLQTLLDIKEIFSRIRQAPCMEAWSTEAEQGIVSKAALSEIETGRVIHTCLLAAAKTNRAYRRLYVEYLSYKS